ncbi:MAG: hypothetical protein EXR99_08315 [Gemmataceae bacterium]|nr:hypothetical protein [Gemmataceae bacterium]
MLLKSQTDKRRGMILLVIVAFLALFTIMGVTYLLYADSQLRQSLDDINGQDLRQDPVRMVDLPPQFMLNFFLERFLYDQPDMDINLTTGATTNPTPDSIYSALRGHSLARNAFSWNDTPYAFNDKPFTGIGKLNKKVPLPGGPDVEEWKIANHTYFSGGPLFDPERGQRSAVNTRATLSASWNPPYTYPDQNHLYLAWLSPDGSRVIPSFHRDYLFGATGMTSWPGNALPNPNWTNPQGKYFSLRPRPMEHGGFPYPEMDGFDVKNLEGYPGGNDSIWIDVGSPVFTAPDGRKYKVMLAPLILELDSRINVNVAGNVMGAAGAHGSNQGWGAWEINAGKVVDATEFQKLIASSPTSGTVQLPGRFNNTNRAPVGPPLTGGHKVMPYSQVDFNGSADTLTMGQPIGPLVLPTLNRPDVKGFQSFPTFPLGNFGNGIPYETNFGGLSSGTLTHSSVFNPQRPGSGAVASGNRAFPAKDTATLLRWNSTANYPEASLLTQVLGNSLGTYNPMDISKIAARSRVTTVSADLNRPGLPVYVGATPGGYQKVAGANFPTAGGDIAFAGVPSGTVEQAMAAVGRVNLNRKMMEYPPVNRAIFSGNLASNGGTGGRYNAMADGGGWNTKYPTYANNPTAGAQVANYERQMFAQEVFQVLVKVTGARDMSGNGFPISTGNAEYEANRYLAQLAANMVDFVDPDNVMTTFTWKFDPNMKPPHPLEPALDNATPTGNRDASLDERVYGFELPTLVLNEGYAEIVNDPMDPFTNVVDKTKKATLPYHLHTWIELINPMPQGGIDLDPSNDHKIAVLEQDPNANPNDSPVYQIFVLDRPDPALFNQENVEGRLSLAPIASLTNFKPDGATKFPLRANAADVGPGKFLDIAEYENQGCRLVNPLGASYSGSVVRPADPMATPPVASVANYNGFFVVGPTVEFPGKGVHPFPYNDPPNNINTPAEQLASLRTPGFTTRIPVADARFANGVTLTASVKAMNHTIVLRRLADPHRPPQANPQGQGYNPYITVDVMNGLKVNDGITNASDDVRKVDADPLKESMARNLPDPDTTKNVPIRTSMGRSQPFAGTTIAYTDIPAVPNTDMANDYQEGLREWDIINSKAISQPIPGQPQHTFFRHNGSWKTETGVNQGDKVLLMPFPWLVHMDREVINGMEITQVAGCKPSEVTQRFNTPVQDTAGQVIGHKAPWMDESTRLYRFLEVANTKNRQYGMAENGRNIGPVNINGIWEREVFKAVCDPNGLNNFTEAEVDAIYDNLIVSRSPGGSPAYGDQPFWGFGQGRANGNDDWTPGPRGLNNSLLRKGANGQPILDLNRADSYQKKELLTKILNNVTTRSNCFAVWLTTGYFEVTDDTVKPVKMGGEIGRSEGTNIRHRMFAIVDRSKMVAFQTVSNQAVTVTGTTPVTISGFLGTGANQTGRPFQFQDGMVLTFDPDTDNEEVVTLKNTGTAMAPVYSATFFKSHATGCKVISRGNPGPWPGFDVKKDPVVLYSTIIE